MVLVIVRIRVVIDIVLVLVLDDHVLFPGQFDKRGPFCIPLSLIAVSLLELMLLSVLVLIF